jgi:hypothetical protein
MVPTQSQILLALLAASRTVYGHGAIVQATGDQGGSGMALGVDPNTPRDGTGREPFQQDSTRFRGDAAESFGETLGQGDNQPEAMTQVIMDITGDQLPQVSQGGELSMTVHQVNADGAGPFTCMINSDGTGTQWTPIDVTTQVPGNERGRNRDGEETDFPLTAAIPANQECTGSVAGQDNLCMVRCENPARAGPFGGVIPVQMANAGGNTNNANVNANGNANANANGNNGNGNANSNANGNANANANANSNNANNGSANANANTANENTSNANSNNVDNTGNANANANTANTGTGNSNSNANGNSNTANTGSSNTNTGSTSNTGSISSNSNLNTSNNSNTASNNNARRQLPAGEPDCNDEEDAQYDSAASLPLGRRASEVAAEAWAKMKLKRSRVGGWAL